MHEPSGVDATTFNRFYKQGWDLSRGELLVDPEPSLTRPGWWARRRLRRAIGAFRKALAIFPESWQSLWALGKIHQRLGAHQEAFDYFAKAHSIDPGQVDVAREAGIAAIDIGRPVEAVMYTRAALTQVPNDPGLISNLAVAQLISGDSAMALESIKTARRLAPNDPISQAVEIRVQDTIAGRRPMPRTIKDLLA